MGEQLIAGLQYPAVSGRIRSYQDVCGAVSEELYPAVSGRIRSYQDVSVSGRIRPYQNVCGWCVSGRMGTYHVVWGVAYQDVSERGE